MMSIEIVDQMRLVAFWLCFTRWAAFLNQIPLFDEVAIPGVVKVFMALIISYAFFPYTEGAVLRDIQIMGADSFWILTIIYAFIGLALGFMIKIIMGIAIISGSIISQNIGLGAVRYFDPNSAQPLGPFEVLIQWCLVIMILSSGALLPMFKGLYLSFDHFSLAHIKNFYIDPEFFMSFIKNIILGGLLLSVPLLITNLLISIIMGITSRSIPQMNILMVSFIISITIGFFVFFITSEDFFHQAYAIYLDVLGQWYQMIT